jgi:hypothetical protein
MEILAAASALVIVVAAGIAAVMWPRRGTYAAVIACALLWLRLNGPLEGYILVSIARGHGLTLGDLLVPVEFLAIAVVSSRKRRVLASAEES